MEEEKKVEKINVMAKKAESIVIGCCILAFVVNLFLSIVNYDTYKEMVRDVFDTYSSTSKTIAFILCIARFAVVGCFIMLGYRLLMLYIESKKK